MNKKNPLLFSSLAENIRGEVHTDRIRRYLLSTDASIFRKEPVCVVYPKDRNDVVQTLLFAQKKGLSVHPRGAGSGLCGSAPGSGIVLDFTKYMNRLIRLDIKNRTFECEPGYRSGQLEARLRGKGLFFPPDPSSGEYASFGGMYGSNASGAHSVKYGNVSDYILDAEVVLSTGQVLRLSEIRNSAPSDLPDNLKAMFQIYRENKTEIENAYPPIRYNVAGYNLRGLVRENRLCLEKLFAGSEGSLGIVTRLQFRLLEKPPHDSLLVAFFDDIVTSARAVQMILPLQPSGIEVMDKSLLHLARESDAALREKIPADVDNVLLIEFDAFTSEECGKLASASKDLIEKEKLTDQIYPALSSGEKQKFWALRKAAVPILYKLKGEKKILALIEDAVVPADCLPEYFRGIYEILNRHQVSFVTYGHIAKGLLHTRPLLNLKEEKDISMLRVLADEVFTLVHSLGGSVSGEHGDGRLRSAYIRKRYPGIYPLFLKTKEILDPQALLNPEIKTRHDPDQMTKNLRFGSAYHAVFPKKNALLWQEGFATEAEKCHGCSKCTTITAATRMCPVYKFTRDENAAPKAKANILRGLLSDAIPEKEMYQALLRNIMEQCVNCGSCYKECPSSVNIPKLAMEAKAQYIRKFGIPLQKALLSDAEMIAKYSRGFSETLYPLLNLNFPRRMAETLTGISAQRKLLTFPARSLFARVRPSEGKGNIRVLYFSGCYAGYIRPEIGEAAVNVLKKAGMQVQIPRQHCCGLPMISKGLHRRAGEKVKGNLKNWGELLRRADYLCVSCSSCGLSLMQEWSYLEDNSDIRMVREKLIHISELVNRYPARLRLHPKPGHAVYHNPCHLKIQPFADSSLKMLSAIPGLEIEDLKSHCCGMAGSWGMLARNFELSRKIGSDMISKINDSPASAGLTDCPTCRMQMETFSTKTVKHPIEIVADCL